MLITHGQQILLKNDSDSDDAYRQGPFLMPFIELPIEKVFEIDFKNIIRGEIIQTGN